jgi:integrative and conjugative element protein (TIGR02256 family)
MCEELSVVRITPSAIEVIAREARQSRDGDETGGALFGFDASLHGPPLVTHALGPGPRAIREPKRFLRDLEYTQAAAEAIHEESAAQWVGEWHTHPGGQPEPSEADLVSYLRHLHDPELGFAMLISCIVVPVDPEWREVGVVAWAVDQKSACTLEIDVRGEETAGE